MGTSTRALAANACLSVLDADFFRALCDPSRLEIIRAMIRRGRADITEIASDLPLDRSVVSRHLHILEAAGVAVSQREGRQVFYELDGPAILAKFNDITTSISPLVFLCCPGPGEKS